jgi:hypothetical protein
MRATVVGIDVVEYARGLQGDILRYSSYRGDSPDDWSRLDYSDLNRIASWDDPNNQDFYLPAECRGSDYSGDSVTVANYRAFLESFGNVDGVFEVRGGHGTYAIAIRLSTLGENEEIRQCLDQLEEYPLIDDDTWFDVENAARDDAWDSWVKQDFRIAMGSRMGEDFNFDSVDDGDLRMFFEESASVANEYWQNETGNSAWIRVERVANVLTMDDLVDLPGICTEVYL